MNYILGLDVSTKTIGISLFNELGELLLIKHISPKIKPLPSEKIQELFEKCNLFETFIKDNFLKFNITEVVIEEPLLRSNNIYTVGTLLKFNGMVSKAIYNIFGVVPSFISSYDARAYAFPELMAKRLVNKKGEHVIEKKIPQIKPTLFGAYPHDVDKKIVIYDKVKTMYPEIEWIYDKKGKLKIENYDMSDSVTCVLGYLNKKKSHQN